MSHKSNVFRLCCVKCFIFKMAVWVADQNFIEKVVKWVWLGVEKQISNNFPMNPKYISAIFYYVFI